MSAINVNEITGRTGLHGPVLTGVSSAADGFQVLAGEFKVNGISTFVGMSTFNGGIDVAGTGEFKVSGVSTFVGISTFNAGINVTGGDVVVGGAATISSAGAITAAGTVRIGGDANNGVAEGFKFDPNGLMQVSRGDGVSAVWAAYTQGSSTQTSRINNNGNAFFLGSLGVGTNNPGQKLHVLGDGSTAVQVSDGTNNQYFASIATADNFSNGSVAGDALIRGQSGFAVSPNNGSSVKLRMDSDGDILINTTTSRLGFFNDTNAPPKIQLEGDTYYNSSMSITRSDNGGSPSNFILAKTRAGNILQDNDIMGTISFQGDDGSDALIEGAKILSEVDGTPAANTLPSNLAFYTNSGGSSSAERMRITGIGSVGIGDWNNIEATLHVAGNTVIDNQIISVENKAASVGQSGRSAGIAITSVSNNNASSCCGIDLFSKQGVGGDTYGVRAVAMQGSSSTDGIGILGHAHVNSGSTNHFPSLPDGGVVAGVYGLATNFLQSNIAQSSGVIGWNNCEYGSLAYGGYFRTKAGPTTVIPLNVNHDGTDLFKVKSDRNVEICEGNLVVGNGYGINFYPQGNSDVNKLDDYEEGTWTPANQFLTITNNSQATYVKVGKLVTVWFDCTYNSSPSDSSQTGGLIEGLPFASDSDKYFDISYLLLNSTNTELSFATSASVFNASRIEIRRPDSNRILLRNEMDGNHIMGCFTYRSS